MFHINTQTRLTAVADGTANTLFMSEGYHADPRWQFLAATELGSAARWYIWPSPVSTLGNWATWRLTNEPVNYRLPIDVTSFPPPVLGVAYTLNPAQLDYIRHRLTAYGSKHSGGVNVAFVDGSVRFLPDNTPLSLLQALSTRAGGEVVDASSF